MTSSTTMPAVFVGHGSPMNTLDDNRYTAAWRAFGATVPAPRAILAVSAHWYTNATAVTAMTQPRVIHDFYGFPDELFEFDYPAPGDPEVAELVAEIAKPRWVGLDQDSWGLDHGTWSVLAHMFPDADVPVVQLSINALQPLDYHLDLGSRLSALRDQGILIVGSGNIVHNLRRIDWSRTNDGFDWSHRFDTAATELVQHDPGDILRLADHADYDLAVPTPDHFIPFVYFAALAAADTTTNAVTFAEGCDLGSISMTSHAVGADCPTLLATDDVESIDRAPHPFPEQSNI